MTSYWLQFLKFFLHPPRPRPPSLLQWLVTFLNLSRLAHHRPCSVEFWLPLIKTREKNANKKLTFHQRIVTKYNIPKRNIPRFINIHKNPKADYDISPKQLTKCQLRTFCAKIAKQLNYCTKSNQTCFFFFVFFFVLGRIFLFFLKRFCLCKYSSYSKDILEIPELLFWSKMFLWFWKFLAIQHLVPFTHVISYWPIDSLC